MPSDTTGRWWSCSFFVDLSRGVLRMSDAELRQEVRKDDEAEDSSVRNQAVINHLEDHVTKLHRLELILRHVPDATLGLADPTTASQFWIGYQPSPSEDREREVDVVLARVAAYEIQQQLEYLALRVRAIDLGATSADDFSDALSNIAGAEKGYSLRLDAGRVLIKVHDDHPTVKAAPTTGYLTIFLDVVRRDDDN